MIHTELYWKSESFVLSIKPLGEQGFLCSVLRKDGNIFLGYIFGKRKLKNIVSGNVVLCEWSNKTSASLGSFKTLDLITSYPQIYFYRTEVLLLIASSCHLLDIFFNFQEGESHLYRNLWMLFESFQNTSFELCLMAYLFWEKDLLHSLGVGLSLDECVVLGTVDVHELSYISPRTGCAVSSQAAGVWAKKLLPFPSLFVSSKNTSLEDFKNAFHVLSYFLEKTYKELRKSSLNNMLRNLIYKKLILLKNTWQR